MQLTLNSRCTPNYVLPENLTHGSEVASLSYTGTPFDGDIVLQTTTLIQEHTDPTWLNHIFGYFSKPFLEPPQHWTFLDISLIVHTQVIKCDTQNVLCRFENYCNFNSIRGSQSCSWSVTILQSSAPTLMEYTWTWYSWFLKSTGRSVKAGLKLKFTGRPSSSKVGYPAVEHGTSNDKLFFDT